MTTITVKCKVCGEVIVGIGYEMPTKSRNHLKLKHKDDFLLIDKLETELNNTKDKYGLYLYGTY